MKFGNPFGKSVISETSTEKNRGTSEQSEKIQRNPEQSEKVRKGSGKIQIREKPENPRTSGKISKT